MVKTVESELEIKSPSIVVRPSTKIGFTLRTRDCAYVTTNIIMFL